MHIETSSIHNMQREFICMKNHLTRSLLNCMHQCDGIGISMLVDTVFVRHVNAINCDGAACDWWMPRYNATEEVVNRKFITLSQIRTRS